MKTCKIYSVMIKTCPVIKKPVAVEGRQTTTKYFLAANTQFSSAIKKVSITYLYKYSERKSQPLKRKCFL